jgi:hypothetical protein
LTYLNQPAFTAAYGNVTTIADLSYYNQPYYASICDIMRTCGDYSIQGDVNIDGVVNQDDVTDFVAGWRYTNGAGAGDYISWTNGDLNRDGTTNVLDFFLLRDNYPGQIPASAMAALGMGGGVPEPSAGVLAFLAALFLSAAARRISR